MSDAKQMPSTHAQFCETMATILFRRYGENAKQIAVRQIEAASGDNRQTWEDVAALLPKE